MYIAIELMRVLFVRLCLSLSLATLFYCYQLPGYCCWNRNPLSNQWCRSVVKSGVRVSQVKSSNCFRLRPTSMISKHSIRFLRAWGALKLVLPSIFWHKSFILDDVKLAELYNNSLNERM